MINLESPLKNMEEWESVKIYCENYQREHKLESWKINIRLATEEEAKELKLNAMSKDERSMANIYIDDEAREMDFIVLNTEVIDPKAFAEYSIMDTLYTYIFEE